MKKLVYDGLSRGIYIPSEFREHLKKYPNMIPLIPSLSHINQDLVGIYYDSEKNVGIHYTFLDKSAVGRDSLAKVVLFGEEGGIKETIMKLFS